jgi:hypothetical protein
MTRIFHNDKRKKQTHDMRNKHSVISSTAQHRSRLLRLPIEILRRILALEDEKLILCVALTCKQLYTAITEDDALWRSLYAERFQEYGDDGRLVHQEHPTTLVRGTLRMPLRPPSPYERWFTAYRAKATLLMNWRQGRSQIWRVKPRISDAGRLPEHLQILVANKQWALASSTSGTLAQLYLIELPSERPTRTTTPIHHLTGMSVASAKKLGVHTKPQAYRLDWILPTDSEGDVVHRLSAPDVALMTDTHVVARMPIVKERTEVPCAIVAWKLANREMTRRLLFRRRNAVLLNVTDRWIMYRRFDDHLQQEIDFICGVSSHAERAALGRVRSWYGSVETGHTAQLGDQDIDNYGGFLPRVMYLAPDVGHLHCTEASRFFLPLRKFEGTSTVANTSQQQSSIVGQGTLTLSRASTHHRKLGSASNASAPLIYRCSVIDNHILRWSLVRLDSDQTPVLCSGRCRSYEQEVYLKPSMRVSDARVLLTGARRDPSTGCFSTWLALHDIVENRLIFERSYSRSIRPDVVHLIYSHRTDRHTKAPENMIPMHILPTMHTSSPNLGTVPLMSASSHALVGTSMASMQFYYRSSSRPSNTRQSLPGDPGPDLLVLIQLGELLVVDLEDGSIRYHFHHDMPSIGTFQPVIGPLHMLVDDDGWRLMLDATSGWCHVYENGDPYSGYELAGPDRLVSLHNDRLYIIEFGIAPSTAVPKCPIFRKVWNALRKRL